MNKPILLRHADGSMSVAYCCREEVSEDLPGSRQPAPPPASARRRGKLKILAIAFALATAMFWATMLTSPPVTEAALSEPSAQADCMEVQRALEPWFKAQVYQRASFPADGYDSFNLMLAWFGAATNQCASGMAKRALENFRSIESMIAVAGPELPDEE